MGMNPFQEKGVPIDKQIRNWSTLNTKPYDPATVHPYTRTRGILMNGIETEAVLFYHNFHRHCEDFDLKRQLAMIRRVEQQEQKMVNWTIPSGETTLEVTIGYEQLAVDLTASMAKNEPDKYVKAALDFALIEDFDHLYRYANLMSSIDPKKADAIVKDLTEVMPGRPTAVEHRHPFDTIRKHYDRASADPLTKMHVSTIIAAEQQTMNYYMNVGNRFEDVIARGLYQEIGMIEEQHVTHYGSLEDPRASWFEMAVLHEYNECYLYYSCMQSEPDNQIKSVWEQMLDYEITHLQMTVDMMKKYENKDPIPLYPTEFPKPLILESSKDYVRSVIANQLHLTSDRTEMVPLKNAENKDRFIGYLNTVNSGEYIPTQQIIADAILNNNSDYRIESNGPHPVPILKDRSSIPSPNEIIEYSLSK